MDMKPEAVDLLTAWPYPEHEVPASCGNQGGTAECHSSVPAVGDGFLFDNDHRHLISGIIFHILGEMYAFSTRTKRYRLHPAGNGSS
jgi:hypothetical protein